MIALRCEEAVAEIVPERGALCSRLLLSGEEILYLDPKTLADPRKNVRGGIPVLFPIAGKPDPGSPLKQHGFARNAVWDPTRTGPASLECRLREGIWDLLLSFTLLPRALRLDFTALSSEPATFQLGFHPYFAVADKAAASVATDATQAFDNRTGETRGYAPPDFTQGEIDLHLLDHREAGTVLGRPAPLRLRWSPGFTRLVLWTLPDQPFLCVEPWTGRGAMRAPATLSFEIST